MGAVGSVYAVSDVHGYPDDLRTGLREAGLLDGGDRWADQDAHLWVLGDLTDRGPDGIGVIRLVRDLQEQAPEQVHVLMGNHEALARGYHLFPDSRFAEAWLINGGLAEDQAALTEDDLDWLGSLPVLGRAGDYLLMHSDTTGYLEWGTDVEDVNATVAGMLAGDVDQHWAVFAALTSRYDFAGDDGADAADKMLAAFGGSRIVHGHSIIGTLLGRPSHETTVPIQYADGRVIAIDGGRYDGGPLLVVQLD